MAQQHYYEAHGELADEFREWFKKASKARQAMLDWCKAQGAGCGFAEGGLSPQFYPKFETPPDPKVWKLVNENFYTPRRGTKDGRRLDEEMRDLCTLHPSGKEIAARIKMQVFGYQDGGLRWRTPAMRQVGRRILLGLPADYKRPKPLQDQLTRISDTDYEAILKKSPTRGIRKPSGSKSKSKA